MLCLSLIIVVLVTGCTSNNENSGSNSEQEMIRIGALFSGHTEPKLDTIRVGLEQGVDNLGGEFTNIDSEQVINPIISIRELLDQGYKQIWLTDQDGSIPEVLKLYPDREFIVIADEHI